MPAPPPRPLVRYLLALPLTLSSPSSRPPGRAAERAATAAVRADYCAISVRMHSLAQAKDFGDEWTRLNCELSLLAQRYWATPAAFGSLLPTPAEAVAEAAAAAAAG